MVRRSAFDRILREMQQIRYRLDDIENSISGWNPQPLKVPESHLLCLPDHLRRTYLIAASKGECNATEVANLTGRCRAVESNYMNQLVRMGWLAKRKDSNWTRFHPVPTIPKTTTEATMRMLGRKTVKSGDKFSTGQEDKENNVAPRKLSIKCLSSDYDGTISPLNVLRSESHVPLETRTMLRQIARFLPISIITMKDMSFVAPRTPFAQAWSAIGGLEMKIGKRVFKRECLEPLLPNISLAIDYAKHCITISGVEIEEKQDSEGNALAFCVDWRRASDMNRAKWQVERVLTFCERLGLKLLRYQNQPFCDVYPVAPDKGIALRETLHGLAVKGGILYLGDSEMDNSAFRASDISLGVINEETPLKALECDYLLKFENVPLFLKALIANNLQFSSDFPMIEANPRKELNTRDVKEPSPK